MKKTLLFLSAFVLGITSYTQNDIGVITVNSPESGCELGAEAIQVDIFNFGADIGPTTFDVTYQIDDGAPISQTQTYVSFSAAETKIVSFLIPGDFSDPGPHTLKVYTELGSDINNDNDTLTVEVINFPTSEGGTLADDNTICEGDNDTLTLDGEVGMVVNWESSTDGGATWITIASTDTFLVASELTETTMYRTLVQSGDCDAVYSNEVTITVDAAPMGGTVEEDQIVCAAGNSGTLMLLDFMGTIENWQMDSGMGWMDIDNMTDSQDFTDLTETTIYRAVVGNGVCNADTSEVATITVVPESDGGTIMSSAEVCQGLNSGDLEVVDYIGAIQQWERSEDDGVTWIPIVNETPMQSYSDLTVTTLYRVLVEAAGCVGDYSDTATITVVPQAEGGTIEEDKSVCAGATDSLFLVDYTGDIVKWQFDEGDGWMDIAETNDTLIVMDIMETTSYRAIVTNDLCPNDTSEIATITVIETTLGGAVIESDSVCFADNEATLELVGHVGDIRWWEQSLDDGVTWTPIANIGTSQGYVDLEETTWYRVLVEGTNCPSQYSDTAIITVYIPELEITANGPTEFCFGESVELSATEGYSAYAWSNGSILPTTVVSTDGYQSVTITDDNGCQKTDSLLITVFELPIADAGQVMAISLGASTTLMGEGGEIYAWTPEESLDDPALQTPVASPLETTYYQLMVTDENGCTDVDSVLIMVSKDYRFKPNNLVTPNGDGFNDSWIIDNIQAYPETTVTIIDRYGVVVYEVTGYNNEWQGTAADGTQVDGTYYYVITSPESEIIFKGHLTVLSK